VGIRLSDVYDFLAAELRSRRHAFSKLLAREQGAAAG
jgi:hypothetical protein